MLCRSVLTAIAISYILCVLLLSGLQKEEMDVNTLKKLERLNVNIHDMNNETLRRECLSKANLDDVSSIQPLVLCQDENSIKVAVPRKGYNEVEAETQDPSMNGELHAKNSIDDETEKADTTKVTISEADGNLNEKNEDEIKYNSPTLENLQHDQIVTEVPTTELPTTDNPPDKVLENQPEIRYNKSDLGEYLPNEKSMKIKQNSTTDHIENDINSLKSSNLNGEIREETNVKLTHLPYNTGKNPSVKRLPQALYYAYNKDNSQFKEAFDKTKVQTITMLKPTTLYLGQPGGASNSEFFPKMSDIRQLLQQNNNEAQVNMSLGKPKDTSNNGKLEDWYSKYFMNNMATTVPSYNNEKALLSIFNVNNDKNKLIDNRQDAYMAYNSILDRNYMTNRKTKTQSNEPASEVFDVNSFIMNDDKPPEKVKYLLSSNKDPFNPDLFNIASPTGNNEEDNTSDFDLNQILSGEKPSKKSSFIGNNLQSNYFNTNFPNNDYQNQNGGDTNNLLLFENNPIIDNKQFDILKGGSFLGNKPAADNFISSFLRKKTAQSGDNKSFLKFNHNQYTQTTIDNPSSDDRIPESLANNVIETDTLSYMGDAFPNNNDNKASKIYNAIPPIVNNDLITKEFNNNLIKPMEPPQPKNDDVAKDITVYDTQVKNNKNRIMERSLGMQYNPEPISDGMIKGENLKLIMNSLKYINQILKLNQEYNTSEPPRLKHTETSNSKIKGQQKRIKSQTLKPVVLNQNISKNTTKNVPPNYNNMANIQKMDNIPTDFIKELAKSVKNIILKDIRQEMPIIKPMDPVTETIVTFTPSITSIATAKSTIVTQQHGNHKTKDANYVVQKILELFEGMKAETTEIPTTPTLPVSIKSYVTKYQLIPNVIKPSAPEPSMNPYNINPQSDNSRKANFQLFNTLTNMNNQPVLENIKYPMKSLHPYVLTYLQQLANDAPHSNHASHLLNQPTPIMDHQSILNQGLITQPTQIISQPQHVFSQIRQNQTPQILNQPTQMQNGPPQIKNQPLQILTQLPQMQNKLPQIQNDTPQLRNQLQLPNQFPQTLSQSPQMLGQEQQINSLALHNMMIQPSANANQGMERIDQQPQITNPILQLANHQTQLTSQTMEMLSPQQNNDMYQMINHGNQMTHHESQMITGTPQFINHSTQLLNQHPQQLNHVQQILNQALQMINDSPQLNNHASRMNIDSPQMLNQSPLTSNQSPQISNQSPPFSSQQSQLSYRSSETLNPPTHIVNHVQQMPNQAQRMSNFNNQASIIMNQALQMGTPAQHVSNQVSQMFNQPQQLPNYGSQMSYQSPQMSNLGQQISKQTSSQTSNQPPQISNLANRILNQNYQFTNQEQQISNQMHQISNPTHQALQLSNQQSQSPYRSSETLNPQYFNHGAPMTNWPPHISEQSSEMLNPQKQYSNLSPQTSNRGPQILNHGPQILNQGPKILGQGPQIYNQGQQIYDRSIETFQLSQTVNSRPPNGFETPSFMTFQTNADEIPPLGIPMETPRLNQVIMLTTKHPSDKFKNDHKESLTMRLNENRKDRDLNRSDLPKKSKFSDKLKSHRDSSYRNRTSKHRLDTFYKNYSPKQHVPYKSNYRTPDYERARPRHDVKRFHEQLERIEDWSRSDKKRSKENLKDCYDDVPSRQQMPMTKLKQRTRYDDTHFQNFMKTQEKVNNMLEQILATKNSSGRLHSVETF